MTEIIATSEELAAFCHSIQQDALCHPDFFITVDTEFMRESTYWPKVCLIQVATDERVALIDVLVDGLDLGPLFALMNAPNILKVFHAARQDMEIFWHLSGNVPAPIFDTQVAAMVCGFGESASYETLVSSLVGKNLDKSSRFSDWSHRPLTAKQVTYAQADVTLLREVYRRLAAKIEEKKRHSWIESELNKFYEVALYDLDPSHAWQKIKVRYNKPRFLAVLRALAEIREIEARTQDVPRARIMKDEVLTEIALQAPQDTESLLRVRGLSQGFGKSRLGQRLLEAIRKAVELPLDQCPRIEDHLNFPSHYDGLLELLRMFLKVKADLQHVAPRLIAGKEDLQQLILHGNDHEAKACSVLSGWRYDVFGKEALALIRGEIAVAWKRGQVVFLPLTME